MFPVLLTIGFVQIYSYSVFLILAWCLYSFLFWRSLKDKGIAEERIFDTTFYASLFAIVFSRLAFILLNAKLFTHNLIKIVAVWVAPGFSFYGALVANTVFLLILSRRYKIRWGYVLDALGFAYPAAFMVGLIGLFLDGSYVGKISHIFGTVHYLGHTGLRYPVQIYEFFIFGIILILMFFITIRAEKKNLPYGMVGTWFFLIFSICEFCLEFLRESSVYWVRITPNQWICIGIFCETAGVLYIRGGGRNLFYPFFIRQKSKITNTYHKLYGQISERFIKRDKNSS
jgi:phosphatidylglycerol---prolipoprotein diacylglyceryl transferase